jgi:regulator of sirC expression with transglutaminase-like and TPR domain
VSGVPAAVKFVPGMRPVSSRQEILARMLNNLKAIYKARSDGRSLEWVLRMRLAIPIIPRDEVADLGAALALQGRVREGAAEVMAVAEEHPELAEQLKAAARSLRSSLN